MAAVSLVPADLVPFATIEVGKAQAMIDDALALAARVAPCITEAGFAHADAAKAVLRRVVLRWHEAGSGALQSETIGPYQYSTDTRQHSYRGLFWPSEIEQLQELCRTSGPAGAFSVDTYGAAGIVHAAACSLNFGAAYCSCGADIAGFPLFERP